MSNFSQIRFDPSNMSAFGSLEAVPMTPILQGDFVHGLNTQMWATPYVFTVTAPASPPVAGDLYYVTNNASVYQVVWAASTTIVAYGSSAPAASGNLVRLTGSGTTPIAYSAYTTRSGVVSGTAAAVDTDSARLRIQSGTNNAGYAYITTRRPVRYRAGQGTTVRFTPIFTAGGANNTQLWGMGTIVNNTPYDGYFCGYNGSSFGVVHYTRGTPAWTAQASWNGESLGFTLDPTLGTPWMIKYPFLGYGDIEFFIQNPTTGRWRLAHVIQYANTVATTQLSDPNLYFLGFTLNSGNTSNKILYCGSYGAFISGDRSFVGNPKWSADNSKDSISTTETSIITIRNCLNYNGVANHGLIRINSLSVGTKEATVSTIRFKLNCALGGTPVFTPRSGTATDANTAMILTSANSIASFDTAGTTITSAGAYIFNTTAGGTASEFLDLIDQDIFIAPGEQLTITGYATGNTTIGVSVNWSEDI